MLEIRREEGIEDRLAESRDKYKLIPTNSALASAITLYEAPNNMKLFNGHGSEDYCRRVVKHLDNALSPQDLEEFCKLVAAPLDGHENLTYRVFISAMMQKVYENGYNDLTFSCFDEKSIFIGVHCCGTKERPFSFIVEGTVGNQAAFCTTNVRATFHDVQGDFADYATNCDFTILGDIKGTVFYDGSGNTIRFANWDLYVEIKNSDVAKNNEVLYLENASD